MSRDPRGRSGGGYVRQAPSGSFSGESGGAPAAARAPTQLAQRRAAPARTSGRGPTDPQRPPPPPPLTDQANEAGKENQHRSGIVRARTGTGLAGLTHTQGDPAGPANPDTGAVPVGRAEAAGQRGRGGRASQRPRRLAPIRPTAQAVDDASGALSALSIRAEAPRIAARQRMQTDENAAQVIPTQIEALIERLQILGGVVEDVNMHAENACNVANTAVKHHNAMIEEIRVVQTTDRGRIDAVVWEMEEQALRETTRSKEHCDWAVAEAEGASRVFQQAADQVERAQEETMQMAAGQFVSRAPPSIAPAIAELRTASVRVAAHEAAARAAAEQAQQAARAAEALIEQIRRILAQQSGGHSRREVGQHTNRQRRNPPGSAGPA